MQTHLALGALLPASPRRWLVLTTSCNQVASDPVWTGESNDTQVLMSRTVNVDEEELLLATNERASKPIKSAARVRAGLTLLRRCSLTRTPVAPQIAPAPDAKPAAGLMSSFSSTFTNGWSALGAMLSVSDQDVPVKDWCVGTRRQGASARHVS